MSEVIVNEKVEFTATERVDEEARYAELNRRLLRLEASAKLHHGELTDIRTAAEALQFSVEERRDVLRRADWLERLYQAKEKTGDESLSADEAPALLRSLAPVPDSPLKREVIGKLSSIKRLSSDERMEQALKEAGEAFRNLGKTGREAVLAEAADMEEIQQKAEALEKKVQELSGEQRALNLEASLDELSLRNWKSLPEAQKPLVTEYLLQKEWAPLPALERLIVKEADRLAQGEKVEPIAETIPAAQAADWIKQG